MAPEVTMSTSRPPSRVDAAWAAQGGRADLDDDPFDIGKISHVVLISVATIIIGGGDARLTRCASRVYGFSIFLCVNFRAPAPVYSAIVWPEPVSFHL
jgi:hypothetical protein